MNSNLSDQAFWVGGKFTVQEIIKKKERKILKVALHKKNQSFAQTLVNENIDCEIENDLFFNKTFNRDEDIHQGYAALVMPLKKIELKEKLKKLKKNSIIIVLDGINDSRNIGSIIRSSAAFSVDAIIVEKKNYNPKSNMMYRSACGMTEVVDVIAVSNINNALKIIKENSFWVYAFDAKAKKDIKKIDFPPRVAFVFGSETHGLKDLVGKNCDERIKINISANVDSLNISNAVSIALAITNKL